LGEINIKEDKARCGSLCIRRLPSKEGKRGLAVAGNTEMVGKLYIVEALLQKFNVTGVILRQENLYLII